MNPTFEELNDMLLKDGVTPEGIIYTDELMGPEGVRIWLFPADHHTAGDIQDARMFLRDQRDVVNFQVRRVHGAYPIERYPPVWKPERKVIALRWVVQNHSVRLIENQIVDTQTANRILYLVDHLSEENRKTYLDCPVSLMAKLAWEY